MTINISKTTVTIIIIVLTLTAVAIYNYLTVRYYKHEVLKYEQQILQLRNALNEYSVTVEAYKDSIKYFTNNNIFEDSVITIVVHDTLHDTAYVDYAIHPITIDLQAKNNNDTLQLDVLRVKPPQLTDFISVSLVKPFVFTAQNVNNIRLTKQFLGVYGLFSGSAVNVGAAFRVSDRLEILAGVNINNILTYSDWSNIKTYNVGFIYYLF